MERPTWALQTWLSNTIILHAHDHGLFWDKIPLLYSYCGTEAVRHPWTGQGGLLTVAAGLDSLVMGENEILGQVRDAFQTVVAQMRPPEVAPRIEPAVVAARGLLPLGFGWQPQGQASDLTRPPTEGQRIVQRNPHHGMAGLVGREDALSPEKGRAVAGRLDKEPIVAVGDRMAHDMEGGERQPVLVASAAIVRSAAS
ncbi:MAG: hypothetical protein FJ011_28535 [Chloroflexi bacterium]|nr:hypothetical protein [Chloroflexota bacterium]